MMTQQLFDNSLLRSVANRLEKHHNRFLGIDNTMRLAKRFNRLRNGKYLRFRQNAFNNELDQLYQENGPDTGPTIELKDGWAVDTSGDFPHLDEMIADSQTIIAERGGVKRGGGERAFFQQIMTDEHAVRFPSILKFATSNAILRPIINYMQLIPTLSVSKPLGVRLNESDARFMEKENGQYGESQLFHRDYHDAPMVYVLVTLRDVTLKSGPFSILPASVSQKASQALNYNKRGQPYRITDDQMYQSVDPNELFEFSCPAGSVLFLDSNACFHYGSRDAEIPRYLMMYAYVSVCRTDFGDILRKQASMPVLDHSARTRRTFYPIPDDASRLRKLLLERTTTW